MKYKKLYESIMHGISHNIKNVINEYGYDHKQENVKFDFDLSDNDFQQIDKDKIENDILSLSKCHEEYYIKLATYYRSQMASIRKWGANKGFTDDNRLESIIVKNHTEIREFKDIAKRYDMSMKELADAILESDFDKTLASDEKERETNKYIKDVEDANLRIQQKYDDVKDIINKYRNINFDTVSYLDLISYKNELYEYTNNDYNWQKRKNNSYNEFVTQIVNYIDHILSKRDKNAEYINLGYANGWKSDSDEIIFYNKLKRDWPKEYVKASSKETGRCCSETTIKYLNAFDNMHNPEFIITYSVDSSD